MRIAVVARQTGNDGYVGFGLRLRVEGQRQLRADHDVLTKRASQHGLGQRNRCRMAALLRGHGDNLSVDELNPILRGEDAGFDHPVVLLVVHDGTVIAERYAA